MRQTGIGGLEQQRGGPAATGFTLCPTVAAELGLGRWRARASGRALLLKGPPARCFGDAERALLDLGRLDPAEAARLGAFLRAPDTERSLCLLVEDAAQEHLLQLHKTGRHGGVVRVEALGPSGGARNDRYRDHLLACLDERLRGPPKAAFLVLLKPESVPLGEAARRAWRRTLRRDLAGREGVILVGRPAQDRLAVLVEADRDTAEACLSRLRRALGPETGVTAACLGLAAFPADAAGPAELLRCAETALCHARAAGKEGQTVFTPVLAQSVADTATLEHDLHRALANGQLALCYQPIIDLQAQRVVAVEVLMRWRHPTLGHVSPDRFIKLAEEAGLIQAMTEWLVDRAGRELEALLEAHPDLRVNINLSALQAHPILVKNLCRRFGESDCLGPDRVTIEVTEGALLEHAAPALEALEYLRTAGCRIALDDFGTGFSSISYLDQFPIDGIKIDKVFVQRIEKSAEASKLIEAMLFMSHALGLDTVAEGVETYEHLAFLAAKGCRYVQGYLFARPLDGAALAGWLDGFRFPAEALEGALWPKAQGLPRLLSDNQEAALKLFVKHVPVAVAMFDREMRYLAASDRWLKDNGIAAEEDIVGRRHYDVLPHLPPKWRDGHRRVLAGGPVERSERDDIVLPDGSLVWLRWEVRPFHTAFGDIAGLIIFSEFITEQVETERARAESEARLAGFLAIASDWLWETDPQGRFAFHSKAGAAGLEGAGLLGRTPWEAAGVADPDRHPAWRGYVAACAARRPLRGFVYTCPDGLGGTVHIEASGDPSYGVDGRFLGYRGTARDVTAREEAKEALERQAAQLNLAAEIAATGHWEVDLRCGRVRWSEAFYRIVGRSPETFSPTLDNRFDIYHPEDRERAVALIREAVAEGVEFGLEARLLWPDGTVRHAVNRGRPVTDGAGRIKGFFGVLQDVTEQVTALERLAVKNRENGLYQRVIEALPDLVYVKDGDGRFVMANAATARFMGRASAADLIGRTDFDFYAAADARRWREDELRAVRDGPSSLIQPSYDGAGTTGWMASLKLPIHDDDGRLCGLIGVDRDITELVEAREAAERQSRENEVFRRMIDILPDLIFAKDRDGRFLAANAATARLMGAGRPEDLIGRTDFDFYEPSLAGRYRADECAFMACGETVIIEQPARRLDGTPGTLCSLKAALRDETGAVVGYVGHGRDVTEQKRAEQAVAAGKARYRDLIEGSLQGLAILKGRRIVFANGPFLNPMGFSGPNEAWRHSRWAFARQPEATRRRLARWAAAAARGDRVDERARLSVRHGDGRILWAEFQARDVVWDEDRALQITVIDITRQVDYENQLQAEKRLLAGQAKEMAKLAAALGESKAEAEEAHDTLHEAVMALQGGFALYDRQDRLKACSPAYASLYGLTPEAMQGMTFATALERLLALQDPLERRALQQRFKDWPERRRQPDAAPLEMRLKGRWYEVRESRTPSGMTVILRSDITERKLAEEELRRLATVDPLTGAFNRHHFVEQGGRVLERYRIRGKPVTLLMLDIDHFKRINDDFGHAAGDETLRVVVKTCRDLLRARDVFARLGGEEFAVLLPGAGAARAFEIAERLRATIAGIKVALPGGVIVPTTSVGVAEALPGESLDGLLNRADKALYAAKTGGRNRVDVATPVRVS